MAGRIGRNVRWLWDNGTVRDASQCLSISATKEDLSAAASILLTYAFRWPDEELSENVLQKRVRFEEGLRQAAHFVGLQLLGTLSECGGVEVVANTSCCGPSLTDVYNTQNYIEETSNLYETTYATYMTDGETLATVAPLMDIDSSGQENIDRLSCVGWRMLLQSIRAQLKALKEMDATQRKNLIGGIGAAMGGLGTAAGAAGLAGGSAAAVVSFLGGPWLVLGLALGAVGLGLASLFDSADVSVFTDDAAFEEVLCHVYDNTQGQPLTRALFANAIDKLTFTGSDHAVTLANLIDPYLDDINVYLQWASAMGQYGGIVDWDFLPMACGCATGAEVQLINREGFPPWTVEYFGIVDGFDAYDVQAYATGHYNVGGTVEKDGDVFYIRGVELLAGSGVGGYYIGDPAVNYYNHTNTPPDFPTRGIYFYNMDSANKYRFKVSNEPPPPTP